MISTTFKDESRITITLPKASKAPVETGKEPLKVQVDARGHFFVNGKRTVNDAPATLVKAMKQVISVRKDAPQGLVIFADGRARHQSVVTVMDAARSLGIVKVSMATRSMDHQD